MKICKFSLIDDSAVAGLVAALAFPLCGLAQAIAPYYTPNYNIRSLGSIPALPEGYGGLTFKADDPNTILIGGDAEDGGARIYKVGLIRGTNGHITGFRGSASYYADAHGLRDPSGGYAGGIDGGLIYGPGNVLLYTSYRDNSLGQIKPGQSTVAKITDLTPLGVGDSDNSVGSIVIPPVGMPGAGRLKILSYGYQCWYDTTLSSDGNGTFNFAPVSPSIDLNFSPEGAVYVAAGSPKFSNPGVLVADFGAGRVASFEVDANGDPRPNTQRDFITDVTGAQGMARDPQTGDFLLSSIVNPVVWVVGGFGLAAPAVSIVSPANNCKFGAGTSFSIDANASQAGGTIQEVDFYVDGIYQGADSVGVPYTVNADPLPAGAHEITAVACGGGLCSTSSVVNVMVTNVPATVAIVYPPDNTIKSECADLQLAASATPVFGAITNLSYYLNGATLIGSASEPPYLLVVSLPAGLNYLTAVAADDTGGQSTSLPIRVIFSPTPTNALSASLLTSGELKLCFRGRVNSTYVFEHSYTLGITAAWAAFATNKAPASQNGLLTVTAPFYPTHPARFYRARRLP